MSQESAAGLSGKASQVYVRLKSDIENGVFPPGRTLSEAMLVEHTGISRTPVREALRRLAVDGLIDLSPRKAPTVSRISLKRMRAMFDYRRILEPAAARLVVAAAAHDPVVGGAFARLNQDFEDLARRSTTAGFDTDFDSDFTRLTASFDDLIVELTPNDYLSKAIGELRPQSARLRKIAHADRGRLGESVREHIEMCRAIAGGNPDQAATACTHHLFHVEQAIYQSFLATTSTADLALGE